MKRRLFLTRRARAELDAIRTYIAQDNPNRAESYVAELREHVRGLVDFPLVHPLRPVLGPGVRVSTFAPYLIAYSIEDQAVRILSIRHGARRTVRIR